MFHDTPITDDFVSIQTAGPVFGAPPPETCGHRPGSGETDRHPTELDL